MSAPSSPSAETDPFDDSPAPLPWERRPDETSLAWAAFTRFRDMGPQRSLYEAYRQETGRKEARQPSGQWNQMYARNEWKARAEAYDAHLDRLDREKRESEHVTNLTSFRDRQRRLAAAATEAAIGLMTKVNQKLTEAKDEPISLGQLPAFLRAAASVSLAATNAEAEALAIDDLLKKLDEREREAEG